MAVTYGFYDSLNHDRLYNAQQMSAIFDGIINDGVFMSVGNQFHTVAGTGMQVIVKSGRAWFDSTWTLNDAEYPLSIDAADVLLTRIDAVVLEVNSEVATRANTIKVVKGTPASTPAKPTLTNTATIHQHALAYVTVAKNITAITNSMIEIVVGKTETPYVTAILQTTDITDLFNQWEDYFQTWFDTVRGTLDGDVALNLQNQITSLRRETLKNTTPPIIGLPASATPDDMFQALAKTGDLHVWRKTVKNAADVPAGYNLGVKTTKTILNTTGDSGGVSTIYYSSSVSVSDSGEVSLKNPASTGVNIYTSSLPIVGKFFYINLSSVQTSDLIQNKIYFVPSDTDISVNNSPKAFSGVVQEVTGYAKIPAGTTTTYPVSTNPNAYQEGSDAKPAGYTLGDVVTGRFMLEGNYNSSHPTYYYADNTPTVSDDGVVSVKDIHGFPGYGLGQDAMQTRIRGKYIQCRVDDYTQSDFRNLGVVYIPEDAVVLQYNSASGVYIDRYQPVTGYAAISAGTTIEYLGKLGDKARAQVVSYVGTGTTGKNNPCSITMPFKIKTAIMLGYEDSYELVSFLHSEYNMSIIVADQLSTEYKNYRGFLRGTSDTSHSQAYGKISDDNKTIYWYFNSGAYIQCNSSGTKYYVLLLG